MRRVAVIGFAQAPMHRSYRGNEIELLLPVVQQALDQAGIRREQIQMTAAASSDFLAGQAFAFVRVLDAVGIYPVMEDSHVDMDGAWSLYEAWVRLQLGDVDCALVYALGKTSSGDLSEISPMSLDPYFMAPLMPDPVGLAALQARLVLESGVESERDWARVARSARLAGAKNPNALPMDLLDEYQLLEEDYVASPLRPHACPPQTDGAAVMVVASEALANDVCARPAWITQMAHRTDTHSLGARRLDSMEMLRKIAEDVGAADRAFDVAELHAQFAHEVGLISRGLGLDQTVEINPSGGPLVGNPLVATGLIRVGEVAQRILDGRADSGLAHAAWGPCLQQNLVCVMEGGS